MIAGAHFLLYSKDPGADQAFFRDVLGLRVVDAGEGRLLFVLPPAEIALHPSSGNFVQRHAGHDLLGAVLYLMCDDLLSVVRSLEASNVNLTEIEQADWGLKTTLKLPSGGEVGLYQPAHATALHLD